MATIKSVKLEIEKQLTKSLEEISIVNLVNLFVQYGYHAKASDIHIEPAIDRIRVRYRIDGLLHDLFEGKLSLAKNLQPEISARIKVLSGLRTDEHLLPQDGRFKSDIEEVGNVDVRVSIVPAYYGENIVLRILAETQAFNLDDLGFAPEELERVRKAMRRSYGMILANGPTGSGKSTTLYTILKELNKTEISIITIEDPIEYSLDGTNQIQVNNQVGLTFASGLRSILRQDPNIVMVGEIRDQETAGIAVNAALTGHLMISTLHTNDAATTFPRLIDMGVPPFLVASTVNVAMGQRLVRTVCSSCKVERKLTKDETKSLREIVPELDQDNPVFYVGEGCVKCDKSGYQGRIGIREVLEVNDEIRKLILNKASAQDIKEAAVKNGMTTMVKDGIQKALAGITSLAEVLRLIQE